MGKHDLHGTLVGLLVLGMILGAGSAGSSQILLKNALGAQGSFEWDSHSTGVADSWALLTSGGVNATAALDRNTSTDGRYSQRWQITAGGPGSGTISTTVRVGPGRMIQPGDSATVAADLKAADLTNAGFTYRFVCYNANWQELYSDGGTVSPGLPWGRVTSRFVVPDGTTSLNLYFILRSTVAGGQGTAWVDGASVTNGETYSQAPDRWLKLFGSPSAEMDVYDVGYAMDMIVLPEYRHEQVQTIRLVNPKARIYLYEAAGLTDQSVDQSAPNDPIGWKEIANHPDWILTDPTGLPLMIPGEPNLRFVDVGNPDYQKMWADRAIQKARSEGFDGVFIDNVIAYLGWVTPMVCAAYPSDALWQGAMTSFLRSTSSRVLDVGLCLRANFGNSDWSAQPWSTWKKLIGGALEEHCFYRELNGQNAVYVGESMWLQEVSSLLNSGSKGYWATAQIPVADTPRRRFALASFLLGVGEADGFGTNDAGSSVVPYSPDFDLVLGSPSAAYQVQSGHFYLRRFYAGMVYVNPTTDSTYRVTLDKNYRTLDGTLLRRGSLLTIPPVTGQILILGG